jgi:epoxyqueuosine reductase
VKFSRDLREPAFAPRPLLAGKDAATLAQQILAMDEDAYRESFRGSAMKRAKLSGLQRNAEVVLSGRRGS